MIGLLLTAFLIADQATEPELGERFAREALANGSAEQLSREQRPGVLETAAHFIEKGLWHRFLETGDDGYELRLLARTLRERAKETAGCPAGQSVEVSQADIEARLLDGVAIVYPILAKQARIQGTVRLLAGFDKSGSPCGIKVIAGHPLLAPAAVNAVKSARIRPFNNHQVRATLDVTFELTN